MMQMRWCSTLLWELVRDPWGGRTAIELSFEDLTYYFRSSPSRHTLSWDDVLIFNRVRKVHITDSIRTGTSRHQQSNSIIPMSAPKVVLVKSLYRSLLRYTSKITNYNFRSHAMRRTRAGFITNRTVTGDELVSAYAFGVQQLAIAKRQSLVSQLYPDTMASVMQIAPKVRAMP